MMRRRSAPSSGPAANGISILPSGDAIVEVMLDNDDDTKKSSTASQIRSRLIRFTKPFAIVAVCLGICSKAMMMKVISERYSSLPILSVFTADDNRESSYMRRSLKIEEATPPSSGDAVDNDKDTNTAAYIDTGKGNLGQFVMEHKAKSDEEKIAKELKIAQNMIKKAELKAKAAESEKVSAKEQKKVDDHKKSIEKKQPNKPQPKVRAHEQHKNKPVLKGSVKEEQKSQSSVKTIKHTAAKDNSKKHPHIKEHHTNKQNVVKQAVKKQSDMKHQPIVKGKKHHDKKEKKAVAGQDKKVKEQHHVAADPIKKDKKITGGQKHSATKQK